MNKNWIEREQNTSRSFHAEGNCIYICMNVGLDLFILYFPL